MRQQGEGSAQLDVVLGDLLRDRNLKLDPVVLPDDGASRQVSWVHATEQVDPRPHLRRHELVCTLGSALVRSRSAAVFASAVEESAAAGVVLGIGEVHLEPPAELVRACERRNIPLLLLPHGIPFLAVNDAILRRRSQMEDEARAQESLLLSQLLTKARSGSDEAELLAYANEALGATMTAGSDHAPVWAGGGKPPSNVFLEQFASLLEFAALEFAREATERQQQLGQLIELVLSGLAHPAAVLPELQSHGMDASELRVSNWPSGSEWAILQRWPSSLIGTTSSSVFVLSRAGSVEEFRELGLVCGYSSRVNLPDLRRALNEATSALRLARSRGGVAGPDALATLDALLEQQPTERLVPFIEQLVTPIIDADRGGRGDLMTTLVTFLGLDGQLRATAARLGVHVNTVRHRLSRIYELTGCDPLTRDGGADLRVGLWAAERKRVISHRLIRPLQ